MSDVVNNLFDEEVPISEAIEEMGKDPKEEVVVIRGEVIPKKIYNLCILHYLSHQYGEDY